MRRPLAILALVLAAAASPAAAQHRVPTPASVLGFTPGAERHLVEWDTLVRYFRALAAASDRVAVRTLGRTTNGAPFLAVFISSPANLARLDQLGDLQRRLADPRTVPDSTTAARLIGQARAFVLITSSIHSTEVGGQLSPLEIAYRLAAGTSPEVRRILDNDVVMLVPSVNPDGVTIVSRWYNQTLGTPAEGTSPPELYHHYVGHDDNRDWYAFTQAETRMVVDSLYDVWHPQVTMDIHQMGQSGARMFVPPYLDPIEPNVDPLLIQGVNALGTEIARRMTAEGLAGISVHSSYDAWTPARAFAHYHGAVRILTETASAALATPVTVPWDSLRPGRGVDPQTASWAFANPWPGGRWTLADIVHYQTAAAMAMLDHVARTREEWVRESWIVAQHAVRGWQGWPYAYVIPTANQDATALATLLQILSRAQVEFRQALQPFMLGSDRYPPGTYVVVLRQPYAAFAKAMLERQAYPDLREYPDGPPDPPYDVTAQTLPLLLGVRVAVSQDSLPIGLSAPSTADPPQFRADGLSADAGARPAVRIGLYKPSAAPIDEGWTRWLFDSYGIPYESVSDSAMRAGDLGARYDALVVADQSPGSLLNGLSGRRYPARYAGGLGVPGVQSLRDFVDGGGTLIVFNGACDFVIGALDLPVTDALDGLGPSAFYAPGSILRLRLDPASPLAGGMPPETIAWFESGPAFEVRDPTRVRVVARYPAAPGDVLLSGWILGAAQIAGKAALVDVRRGRGRVILFGFRPQYRGQSQATYPLLWNALRSAVPSR